MMPSYLLYKAVTITTEEAYYVMSLHGSDLYTLSEGHTIDQIQYPKALGFKRYVHVPRY